MELLRTPDSAFEGLEDFPFAPHYTNITTADGSVMRLHHLDEGPRDGAPILLMHGEPSWCYLYRKMIPALVAMGYRCLAPDLAGFGRSDKPAAASDYSYESHVAWMSAWLTQNDFKGLTLFCQDWGGLIGLRLATAFPDRFDRLVISNTGLPTGEGSSPGFDQWLAFSQSVPVFPVGDIVAMGTAKGLSDGAKAAYNAPFPEEHFKVCARLFPTLVPITPQHPSVPENKAAWEVLKSFRKPVLTLFGDSDPVSRGGEKRFITNIPGAQGQDHTIIEKGGHFIQEDQPEVLAGHIDRLIKKTR